MNANEVRIPRRNGYVAMALNIHAAKGENAKKDFPENVAVRQATKHDVETPLCIRN